jgi:hypothetical protein
LAFALSDETNQSEIDYVQIGLASLRHWPGEAYTMEIFEQLAVEVIDTVLGELDTLKELRKHLGKHQLLKSNNIYVDAVMAHYTKDSSKGSPCELLNLETLRQLPAEDGITVAEFARQFLTADQIPAWQTFLAQFTHIGSEYLHIVFPYRRHQVFINVNMVTLKDSKQ